jgi:hypothetical protein
MKGLVVAAFIAMCSTAALAAAENGADSRREQAQSLVATGKPAEALPLYDELTAAASPDAALYKEALRAAAAAHDKRRTAIYFERQAKAAPDDFVLQSLIAYAWRMAGDEAEARRAGADFIVYWKASTNPALRARPFFRIDQFGTGNATVTVYQCVEVAGKLGVGYLFDIATPTIPPPPPGESPLTPRQRIVLEHDRAVQELLAKQLNKPDVVRPSLDLLSPGQHATLRWFDAEPDYLAVRDIVGKYVVSEGDLASKPPMGNAWAGLTCTTDTK